MKNRKRKTILLVIIIILMGIMFLVYPKNKEIYKDNKENKITFAIMVEKNDGKYVEYRNKEWPKVGYRFSKSECIDRDNNSLGDLIEYNAREGIAVMKSKKSTFCTLYFDKDSIAPVVSEGSFYIGSTPTQEYTNKVNEEIHIKIDDEDVIEYCLINVANSALCNNDNNWKVIPELDSEGWFKTTGYNLGETNELKTVYLYLKDGARNISEVKEDSIVLDTTPPSCQIGGNPTNWQNTDATLTQGGTDTGVGTIYYSWDNKNNYSTTKVNKEVSSNGTYTLYVKDGLGNETSCSVEVTKIDKTPPIITFGIENLKTAVINCSDPESDIDGSKRTTRTLSGTSNVTITGTCKNKAGLETTENYTYRYDKCASGKNTCKGGYVYSAWGNYGSCSLRCEGNSCSYTTDTMECDGCKKGLMRCRTRTKSWSSCKTGSNTCKDGFVENDKIKPTCSITVNTTGWAKSKILTATASDLNGSTIKYSWDDNTNYSTTNTSKTVEANGTYTLFVKNSKGYESYCSIDVSKIDNTLPTCEITGNTDSWEKEKTLVPNGSDSEQSTVYYSWNDNTHYNTTKINKKVTENGTYILWVKDAVGNEISCAAEVDKIDKDPPSCSISGNPTSWTKENQTLTGSGTDSGNGSVYYKWDTGSYGSTANTNKTKTVSTNGTYTLYVKDELGNETSCNVTVDKIDKEKPTCTISKSNTGTTSGVTVSVICNDTIGEVDKCNSTNVSTTGLKSDTTYTVTDKAGNSNTCTASITSTIKYRIKTRSCSYSSCATGSNTCQSCLIYNYSGQCTDQSKSFSGSCGKVTYDQCEVAAINKAVVVCKNKAFTYAIGAEKNSCCTGSNTCKGGYIKGSESDWSGYDYDSCSTESNCTSSTSIVTSCDSQTFYS